MDAIAQTNTAVDLLTPLVEGTRPDQLTNATPCTEWTVRNLVNHFVLGGHMFATSLRGESLAGGDPNTDLLGEDYLGAYQASIADFRGAVAGLSDLETPVTLPFGTLPADAALRIAAADLLVHAWDLSQATGQPFDPPTEFVESVDGFYRLVITPDFRATGLFGSPREAAADADAMDRLVAFAGRQP